MAAVRNPLLGRDLDAEPYSPDEERVCTYLQNCSPDVGCGDDPIGFLIASHAWLVAEKQGRTADTETALPRTDLPVPDRRPPILGDPTNQYRTSTLLTARDHPLSTSAMGATRDP